MEDFIQMKNVGTNGRFGNQLFQYAFLRKIAELNNCKVKTPSSWLGRKLFPIAEKDLPITEDLPRVTEKDLLNRKKTEENWLSLKNVDIDGHFENNEFLILLSKKECRQIFSFNPKILSEYKKKEGFYIAAHLRRGDLKKCEITKIIISQESVERAILKFGYDLKDVIWVSDGNTFKGFTDCDFVNDFLTLIDANVLFRSNSTFSFWAGILGYGKVYSPIITSKHFPKIQDVEYTSGNEEHHYYENQKLNIGD